MIYHFTYKRYRQKELLNIEIEIKSIELKRLHQLYEDEIRARLEKNQVQPVLEETSKKNWIGFLTGR